MMSGYRYGIPKGKKRDESKREGSVEVNVPTQAQLGQHVENTKSTFCETSQNPKSRSNSKLRKSSVSSTAASSPAPFNPDMIRPSPSTQHDIANTLMNISSPYPTAKRITEVGKRADNSNTAENIIAKYLIPDLVKAYKNLKETHSRNSDEVRALPESAQATNVEYDANNTNEIYDSLRSHPLCDQEHGEELHQITPITDAGNPLPLLQHQHSAQMQPPPTLYPAGTTTAEYSKHDEALFMMYKQSSTISGKKSREKNKIKSRNFDDKQQEPYQFDSHQSRASAIKSKNNAFVDSNTRTTRKVSDFDDLMKSTTMSTGSLGGSERGKGKSNRKDKDGRWSKRFIWPEELHKDFASAVFLLGLERCSPAAVLAYMETRNRGFSVANHLGTNQQAFDKVQRFLKQYQRHRKRVTVRRCLVEATSTAFDEDYYLTMTYDTPGADDENIRKTKALKHSSYLPMKDYDSLTAEKYSDGNFELMRSVRLDSSLGIDLPSQSIKTSSIHDFQGAIGRGNDRQEFSIDQYADGQEQDILVLQDLSNDELRSPVGSSLISILGIFNTLKSKILENRQKNAALSSEVDSGRLVQAMDTSSHTHTSNRNDMEATESAAGSTFVSVAQSSGVKRPRSDIMPTLSELEYNFPSQNSATGSTHQTMHSRLRSSSSTSYNELGEMGEESLRKKVAFQQHALEYDNGKPSNDEEFRYEGASVQHHNVDANFGNSRVEAFHQNELIPGYYSNNGSTSGESLRPQNDNHQHSVNQGLRHTDYRQMIHSDAQQPLHVDHEYNERSRSSHGDELRQQHIPNLHGELEHVDDTQFQYSVETTRHQQHQYNQEAGEQTGAQQAIPNRGCVDDEQRNLEEQADEGLLADNSNGSVDNVVRRVVSLASNIRTGNESTSNSNDDEQQQGANRARSLSDYDFWNEDADDDHILKFLMNNS